jgi:hypothetical protein
MKNLTHASYQVGRMGGPPKSLGGPLPDEGSDHSQGGLKVPCAVRGFSVELRGMQSGGVNGGGSAGTLTKMGVRQKWLTPEGPITTTKAVQAMAKTPHRRSSPRCQFTTISILIGVPTSCREWGLVNKGCQGVGRLNAGLPAIRTGLLTFRPINAAEAIGPAVMLERVTIRGNLRRCRKRVYGSRTRDQKRQP